MVVITSTVITCPACGTRTEAMMPEDACVQAWACPACGDRVTRQDGDCCVFCSYADDRCPPEQEAGR